MADRTSGIGIFVTGTDTGVGKTTFSCELICWLRMRGYRVGAMKPVETGYLLQGDGEALQRAACTEEDAGLAMPYRMETPASPHLASKDERIPISRSALYSKYCELSLRYDVTVVEGAGGLLVPLTEDVTFGDLVKDWKVPVLVVATNRLGTINHTLLTLHYCAHAGIEVLGFVMNRHGATEDPHILDDNPRIITKMTGAHYLGEIPVLSEEQRKNLGATLQFFPSLDLDPLAWWVQEKIGAREE